MFNNTKDSVRNTKKILGSIFDPKATKKYIDSLPERQLTEKEKQEKHKKEMANLKKRWPAVLFLVLVAVLIGVLAFVLL